MPMFVTEERGVVSPPLIKSPGCVVHLEMHAYVDMDEGTLQLAWQASDAVTGELFEWRMPPTTCGREFHVRALLEGWRRFLVLYQETTAPF